jgi:hypothetical protein
MCAECGALFEDEAGTTSITDLEEWKTNEGKTEATGHSYSNGNCTACGEKDPNYTESHETWKTAVVWICVAVAVVVATIIGVVILRLKIRKLKSHYDKKD